jgi:hypothetical protein
LPGVVVHAFNPSTWEGEAGGFLSSRPAWSTKYNSRTAKATQRNSVSKNLKKKKKKKKNGSFKDGKWGIGLIPGTPSPTLRVRD